MNIKTPEELEQAVWNHPAIKYANSIIVSNAIRTGTKGWEGESAEGTIAKAIRERDAALEKTLRERVEARRMSCTADICLDPNCLSRTYNIALDDIQQVITDTFKSREV